jgi:hypothetical protein
MNDSALHAPEFPALFRRPGCDPLDAPNCCTPPDRPWHLNASRMPSCTSARDRTLGAAIFSRSVGVGVMLDCGHNPDAFAASNRLKQTWNAGRLVGIIGVPGDRGDGWIREAGAVAAGAFDERALRKDEDLPGRRPGQCAALLPAGIACAQRGKPCQVIDRAQDALDQASPAALPEISSWFSMTRLIRCWSGWRCTAHDRLPIPPA